MTLVSLGVQNLLPSGRYRQGSIYHNNALSKLDNNYKQTCTILGRKPIAVKSSENRQTTKNFIQVCN